MTAIAAACLAVTAAGATVPPVIPGGFADGDGRIGIFAVNAGVVAVDLRSGATVWDDPEGRWPLASRSWWVAVASPDAAEPLAIRIRFLRPADGRELRRTDPVRVPAYPGRGESLADGRALVIGGRNSTFTLRTRVDDARSRARLSWESRAFVVSGIRPTDPAAPPVTGGATINPATGTVTPEAWIGATVFDPPPAMPAGWNPEAGVLYWRSGSWGDRPVPFALRSDPAFFSCTTDATRVLRLHRRGRDGTWTATEIARGGSYVPDVSLDGRWLALHEATTGRGTTRLLDLAATGDAGPGTLLPDLDPPVRPPFAVRLRLLLFLTETRGERAGQRTEIRRGVNALDWSTGRPAWALALASRWEQDPVPGARP